MPISARGQREGRRRRVLRDDRSDQESAPATSTKTSAKSAKESKRAYALEACREHQPVVTDFLPRRNWTFCVLALLGLCLVAVPQSLYSLTTITPSQPFAALELAGTSTVASWVSSMLLASSAVLCLAIYLLRRHRLDDYRARYRWWLLMSVVCCTASLNAVTHLHHIVPFAMVQWTGKELTAGGAIWSELVLGSCLALLAIRMGIEMRHCRGALVGIVAAFVGYALHSLIQHQVLPINSLVLSQMISAACMHLGHLSIAITLALYARHVYRDAHGELVVPANKKRRASRAAKAKKRASKRNSEEATEAANAEKSASSEETHEAASDPPAKSKGQDQQERTQTEDDSTLDFQKLSKSERRRLRKQQRRERQAA